MESLPGDQSLGGILETAMKLANEDEDAEETKKVGLSTRQDLNCFPPTCVCHG